MSESRVRAVLYLRVSQDREMDGLAIDRHREACLKIADERGWKIIEEYVDQSISATDKSKIRPGYDRMVADYAAGKIDAILCWDLDRLTRQPRELEDWVDAAKDRGLKLVTANGEADLTTDGGRMYARVKAAVAAGEVERKAERQSLAHQQRARQGRAPKGQRPVGYATNGDVVEHEAAAVKEMFRLFAVEDGTTIAAIARALSGIEGPEVPASLPRLTRHSRTVMIERNERRVAEGLAPKPVPEDGRWHSSSVLDILRNPRYAGYSVYTNRMDRTQNKRRTWYNQIVEDDDGEPIRGQWEPIVDELTWWRVQERLNEPSRITNRTGSTARKHLGAGLYLCGLCERPVRTGSARYRCAGCGINRTREHVDDWVLRIVRARLARPDLADTIPTGDEPRLQAIAAEIGARQAKIKRAQSDYDNEIIEGYDLKRVRERENTAIAALEAERRSLTATTDLGGVLDARDPVKAFEDADLMIKRRVIDFLCTVRLYPHPQGRKTFDPETVKVTPKASQTSATA